MVGATGGSSDITAFEQYHIIFKMKNGKTTKIIINYYYIIPSNSYNVLGLVLFK